MLNLDIKVKKEGELTFGLLMSDSDEVIKLKKYVIINICWLNYQIKQKEMSWDRDKAILQ